MLLSPEFDIMELHERSVVIRIDDVLLVFAFFAWLAKTAVHKQMAFFRRTPLNIPIITYISVCIFSSIFGVYAGRINPVTTSFYILKYIEYPMIFFMVVNILRDQKQIKRFLTFIILTYVIVCLNSYFQIGHIPRVTAPFEGLGSRAQPNTFSGYLMFIMAILSGFYLHARFFREKWLYGCLFLLGIPPFLYTFSRSGYVAIIAMFIALAFLTRKKRTIIILGFLVIFILSPFWLPSPVVERIKTTFVGPKYELMGFPLQLERSAGDRILSWNIAFKLWPQRPWLGYGVSYIFLDIQYITVLLETGVLGIFAFAWILVTIFRSVLRIYDKFKENIFAQALSLGYLAGFVGLLLHALTVNTFIIVRIMEPFWFITAMVIIIPQLEIKEAPIQTS